MNVPFTTYIRLVLPLDGYVFWVRADLVSKSALVGALMAGGATLDQQGGIVTPAAIINVEGSFHYATDIAQEEAMTTSVNRLLFTTSTKVDSFNNSGVNTLFIATFDGMQFAFSGRDFFFDNAGIYHYIGNAVFNEMQPQLINSVSGFDSTNIVSSNSVPLWLALNQYIPIYFDGISNPIIIYPSFIVPQNLKPPFAVVHVPPESTRALQPTPVVDSNGDHWQLVTERPRVTLWGTRSFTAMDFMDCVERYSVDHDTFGVMNAPVVRDEQRVQRELQAMAMKKTIEFEISYYQTRVRNVSKQLILSAIPTFYFSDFGSPPVLGT